MDWVTSIAFDKLAKIVCYVQVSSSHEDAEYANYGGVQGVCIYLVIAVAHGVCRMERHTFNFLLAEVKNLYSGPVEVGDLPKEV